MEELRRQQTSQAALQEEKKRLVANESELRARLNVDEDTISELNSKSSRVSMEGKHLEHVFVFLLKCGICDLGRNMCYIQLHSKVCTCGKNIERPQQ